MHRTENNASDDGKALESIINSLGVNTDPKQQIKLHFKRLNFLRQAVWFFPLFYRDAFIQA